MKRFRNCLIWLIVFGLSLISFWYCWSLDSVFIPSFQLQNNWTVSVDMDWYNWVCVSYNYSANGPWIYVVADWVEYAIPTYSSSEQSKIPCYTWNSIWIKNAYNTNRQVMLIKFKYPETTCPECETCPTCLSPNVHINKIECDWWDCSYSDNQLMRVQTWDHVFINLWTWVNFDSYHVNNNWTVNYYFSSDEVICPIYTWNEESSWNWSALYINDIQHIWAPLINITIPEEFDWDYIYTWNWDEFDLDIKWYNVDTAYIDWIITTQKTLPNNTDFSNIISGLIPLFIPWLVIIACLYFIFRFIKKVF